MIRKDVIIGFLLGAILNLVVFFILIKMNEDHKARGVLLATLMAAIIVIINKI